jgi:hypothetical protein
MAATANAPEFADLAAEKARQAAAIPAIWTVLPTGIESLRKILRGEGFAGIRLGEVMFDTRDYSGGAIAHAVHEADQYSGG